ncbi:MAG: VIT and VWA domain-containing protein [Lachnospiraceae bacterium]|nr:VIT and VWA domain-containing protein [Lachnospiraceae bacterium]
MKKHNKFLCFLSVLLMLVTLPIPPVYAEEEHVEEEDKTGAPYFYVETQDVSVDSFPLKKTSVTADINGVIADIHVVQSYANEGTSPINACYVFPASTKVTVHGMQMQIGNQLITAKIKEKEEAKEEFEEAKEEGKSASLLSEERPNVFTMNIANIMPGDKVSVDLHYTELITPTDGVYQFVYPTVSGPRYVGPVIDDCGTREEWVATPYLPEGTDPKDQYDIHVNLSAAVPITDLTSSSHEIAVQWEESTKAAVSLADVSDYAGNRDFILDYKMTGQDITTGLMLNTGKNENFFMLMVQPPERCNPEEIPPREYIFVLDISGSMSGYPLETAKELIKNLVSDLRATDTFNLILFSGASMQMSERSVPANEENINKAIQIIDEQEGSGGTELAPALRDAIAIPNMEDVSRSIVIITDGYIYGEKEIFEIIHENIGDTDFFPFGIGRGVNRNLIEGIAKTGQGEPFVVTDREDASETAGRFKTYIQSPVMTDINVKFDGFDVYDVEPAVLPTLFAQRPIVLLGKWRGEPTGTVQITGKTGTSDYVQTISVAEMVSDENSDASYLSGSAGDTSDAKASVVNAASVQAANMATAVQDSDSAAHVQTVATAVILDSDVLSYLWAQKRIERLTDYGLNESDPDVKEEVTQLGLTYNILTPYTSFIAVTETVRNPDKNSTDVDQPLPLPLEVSNFAVGGYLFGSEPAEILLIAALALIMAMQLPFIKRRLHKRSA